VWPIGLIRGVNENECLWIFISRHHHYTNEFWNLLAWPQYTDNSERAMIEILPYDFFFLENSCFLNPLLWLYLFSIYRCHVLSLSKKSKSRP
jgi:hypothetical protein